MRLGSCWLVGVGLLFALWLFWPGQALVMPSAVAGQPAASGISQPANGETISGLVTVQGTASHANFLRYELAFFREATPETGWIVFAEGEQPVIAGTLGNWDTSVGRQSGNPVFPDGRYRLRLRVVRTDYNYDEYIIAVTIANDTPTPTPTAETDEVGGPASRLSATREVEAMPTGDGADSIAPSILPSLTPFPTPTRLPTPVRTSLSGDAPAENATGGEGGVLGRLAAIDYGRFGQAFWYGVSLTAVVFAAFGGYLIVRNTLRFFWRMMLRLIHRWRLRRQMYETYE